jgi:hypothetical protein
MKKFYVFALLCVPLCLIFGLVTLQSSGLSGQEQARGPSYHLETDHISMTEVGKLLERLGKEIQKNNSISVGGKTYPFTGNGGIEFSVMQRQPGQTGIQIEIGSGQTETPTRGKTYVAYAHMSRSGAPAEFADLMAKLGEILASKGMFVMENHKVALDGTASVAQRLTHTTRQRGQGQPYTFYADVVFGESDFPLPEDEEDDVEAEKRGDTKEIAKKETKSADHKAIAELYDSLSKDLKAGKLHVDDQDFEIGENIMYGLTHLIATDGKSQRIRVGFMFGEALPQTLSRPRYSEEFFDAPMKKVGALLKNMGTGILETGTFKLEDTEFTVKQMATYEISAGDNGFSIELRYSEPPKEEK